jgi:hypothetical protein
MTMKRRLLCLVLCSSCAGDPSEPESPAIVVQEAVSVSPMRDRARKVDNYLINYGSWNDAEIETAKTHQLVILSPNPPSGLTRQQVAAIQAGTDPADPSKRVIVLCYVSIGEDLRTWFRSDEEMRADPRFAGDGSGPRMDPRGPGADGQPLGGIDPLGVPSNGGTGYASYYLDDVSAHNSPGGVGDGIPDRNGVFHSYFVNAGDPKWFDVLQDMTVDGPDGVAGLREMLTTSYGHGLGCDGVFLDTLDTAAPNSWSGPGSANQAEFEWTAPGFAAFIQRLRNTYPDIVIVQNRALFFFNPFNPQFQFIPRGNLDFVLFESYRLTSGPTNNPHPYYYPDNRFNFAPKLMAEANRPDGFRVLSLGYAEGPADQMAEATLVGQSLLGYDSLIEDIRVAERLAGFRHYLTDSHLTLVNHFVEDHADLRDSSPPVWTSTWNDHSHYPQIPTEATARVGIQEVVPGTGQLTVRWDVALDLNRVSYALYYQTAPFDFVNDPGLTSATRLVLPSRPPASYSHGVGPGIFAYEAAVTNLAAGQTYYLIIRAYDDSAAANGERNQVVLTGVPQGAPAYLGRWRASNGVTSLTYRFQYTGTWSWRRVYIDRDRMPGTGFATGGLGADFLIENGTLWRYTGNGSTWSWSAAGTVRLTTGAIDGMTFVQWDLNQGDIGSGYRDVNLLFQVQKPGGVTTGTIYEHVYTSSDPASAYLDTFAENDAAKIYYHAEIGPAFTWKHLFIDDDHDAATGYPIGGVGAGYLIENGKLYRYTAARPGWGWTVIGDAHLVVNGRVNDWWISRSDVGAGAGSPFHQVVFQANGGVPAAYVSPIYAHRFSP